MESSRQIEATAASWLARRTGSGWSDADEAQFNQWLQASTANRVAYVRLNAGWKQADRLKAVGAGTPSSVVPARGEWRFSSFPNSAQPSLASQGNAGLGTDIARLHWRIRLRAVAASIVLAVAVSAAWYLWPVGPSYRTPVGGLASVPMSDGSKITLNTDSKIRIALTQTERRVNLEQGEAFFEVAKDSQRPFVVSAGDKRVVAVGTKFSVRRDGDEVRVVVTEGSVRVERGEAGTRPVTRLAAGSVARASDTGVLVQERPLPEVEEYLSWRAGYVIFRNTALADAVAEFNRYNTRQIVIADPAIAAVRIGGNFRAANVEAFLHLLENGFPIHIEQSEERILLSAAGPSN